MPLINVYHFFASLKNDIEHTQVIVIAFMYQTSEMVLNISARRAVVTVVVGCATAKSAVKRTTKLALNMTAKVAVKEGTANFT